MKRANVNIKKFLSQHITDFELVMYLQNSKKIKLNLNLNGRALFFPCIWNIHLEKLIGHV